MRRKCALALLCTCCSAAQNRGGGAWKFAVSGDSRNCGDVVMPAIAKAVQASGARFYWHLGDFRAIFVPDEDMSPPPALGLHNKPMDVTEYRKEAWPDFIAHQLMPFGDVPVYLTIGNHETIIPMTRGAWIEQFARWLDTPALRAQRLQDDPKDEAVHAYSHWTEGGVDFISLDNATPDQFDAEQMKWLHGVLARDEASPDIQAIVVGMHEALPGSVSRMHSMSEGLQGDRSGRETYEALWHAENVAHKETYVVASHSHYYMDHVFDTADWKGRVLPGWIIGTAGAQRYKLPPENTPEQHAQTNIYGYVIGTVSAGGTVSFEFKKLSAEDLRAANGSGYPEALVRWCYDENHQ